MTMNAQFCCILRVRSGVRNSDRPGPWGRKGPYQALQAAGALRETTQSRSHDPTAQPQR